MRVGRAGLYRSSSNRFECEAEGDRKNEVLLNVSASQVVENA